MSDPIHQEVTFKASPQQVYEALVDAAQHSAFTGAKAEISSELGGTFSCHEGQVVGRHIELEPNKRIVQAWRIAAWDDGYAKERGDTTCTINLSNEYRASWYYGDNCDSYCLIEGAWL